MAAMQELHVHELYLALESQEELCLMQRQDKDDCFSMHALLPNVQTNKHSRAV